jgi:hypothetical protein
MAGLCLNTDINACQELSLANARQNAAEAVVQRRSACNVDIHVWAMTNKHARMTLQASTKLLTLVHCAGETGQDASSACASAPAPSGK